MMTWTTFAAAIVLLGCGATPSRPSRPSPPRECVPAPEPEAGEPPPIAALQASVLRMTVEVPKARIEEEAAAALPREATGREEGSALFARWEADWRVKIRGRPRIAISEGRITAEADADLTIDGRVGRTKTRCETRVNVVARGKIALGPDWSVALEGASARTKVGECRLTGFPIDASGILQPIAEREVQRGLERATKDPIRLRGIVRRSWRELSSDRTVGPILVRARPESIALGMPTCRGEICTMELEVGVAPEAWVEHEPERERARPLPDARMVEGAGPREVQLRARLNLGAEAIALLAALPPAEGEGDSTIRAELRLGARGAFVTLRDRQGRGLAHMPIEVAGTESGLVLKQGREGGGLAWPERDDPCLGLAGAALVQAWTREREVPLPGTDLLDLVPQAVVEEPSVRYEVRGVREGMLVVDVVARARRIRVDAELPPDED